MGIADSAASTHSEGGGARTFVRRLYFYGMALISLIAHAYLATAGHTPLAHIKAMITGWDELEEEAQSNATLTPQARV